MAKPISEQVVVITGASSGIGRETALRLSKGGAKVVLAARRDEALDDLVGQIQSEDGQARACRRMYLSTARSRRWHNPLWIAKLRAH